MKHNTQGACKNELERETFDKQNREREREKERKRERLDTKGGMCQPLFLTDSNF